MYCCKTMVFHLEHEDRVVHYVPKYREYGVTVPDGGSSYIVIEYCPWCGSNLPSSLRDEWFDILDGLGLEPDDAAIPEDLKSDVWWKTKYGVDTAPREMDPNDRDTPNQADIRGRGQRVLHFDFEDDDAKDSDG